MQSSKKAGLVVAIIALVIVGGIVWRQNNGGYGGSEAVVSTPSVTPSATPIAMAEVAKHNSAASCYSVIDNNVYDLTSWISKHPGGEGAILKLCGTDGSSLFHGQHGSNQKQANVLATFKLGALAQ